MKASWTLGRAPVQPDASHALQAHVSALTTLGTGSAIGVGIDCELISKVERANRVGGKRRLDRLFTRSEQIEIQDDVTRQAGRFAAKEAVAKALGTGFRNGLAGRHIEILANAAGQPFVVLSGPAAIQATQTKVARCLVSWTYNGDTVTAVALAVGEPDTPHPPLPLSKEDAS